MESDGEIVRHSVADPEAFGEIFSRHFDAVLAFARRRVGWDPGEDIAERTMLVAFERRASFDPGYESARPWLLGIATNLIRHHVRDERVHLLALARAPVDPSMEPVDHTDRLDAERLRPALMAALLELTSADRETFLLVSLGELTYEHTAAALDIPVGTVRSRMHRVRALLRERFASVEATTHGEEGESHR